MTLAELRRTDAIQASFARLAAEAARRSRFRCPECNSVDGMEQWSPENLVEAEAHELPVMFYRRLEDGVNLYASCGYCCVPVPEGYVLLTDEEVAAKIARVAA